MTENILVSPGDKASALPRPRAFDTILYGGLAVGVLDGLAAVISSYVLRGTSPIRIFQFIASGLLGPEAFRGGWATTLLGVLLHFLIAFIVTTIYYGASIRFPTLIRRAVICGMSYGVMVYFVMSYVVLPLSAVRQGAFSLRGLLTGVLVHAFCVGLPIALIARRSS
ncbi:MAG: hypothetical protein AB7U82_26040 [Blastocatellales bacterium]